MNMNNLRRPLPVPDHSKKSGSGNKNVRLKPAEKGLAITYISSSSAAQRVHEARNCAKYPLFMS